MININHQNKKKEMLLHVDEYGSISYYTQQKMLKIDWKSATSKLRTENYASRFDMIINFMVNYNPKFVLANFENAIYKGRSDLDTTIFHKLRTAVTKSGVHKFAFINSNDPLSALLFEPVINSKIFHKVDFMCFDSEEGALKWLSE